MPSNTTIEEFFYALDLYNGDYKKATRYEQELSYYRKHGYLPIDAICIQQIRIAEDDSLVIVHNKKATA